MVRQEYEERIKGLMPAALQQELEDTITSLKAQVRPRCSPDTNQIEFKALYSFARWAHVVFSLPDMH